jgi:hypothetical protein
VGSGSVGLGKRCGRRGAPTETSVIPSIRGPLGQFVRRGGGNRGLILLTVLVKGTSGMPVRCYGSNFSLNKLMQYIKSQYNT